MGTELETTQAQPLAPVMRISETVATIKARVQMVQHVMKDVMKRDVHYGQIPGTPKPTLYKPGAEIIALAFQFAPRYSVEDLSAEDSVRYRTTCDLYSRETGLFIGSGQGECSSDEEKYHWRKPVSTAEYQATPEDRRRIKFYKSGQGEQVRIEPADIANTVLKMSEKRSFIDAIRTASSCSDMFAQDLEDLPVEVRNQMGGEEAPAQAKAPEVLGPKGWKTLVTQAEGFGYPVESITAAAAGFGYEGPGEKMPRQIAKDLYRAMRDHPRTADESAEPSPEEDPDQITDAEREILDMPEPEWMAEEAEPKPATNGGTSAAITKPQLGKLGALCKELEELGVPEEKWRADMEHMTKGKRSRKELTKAQAAKLIERWQSSIEDQRAKLAEEDAA